MHQLVLTYKFLFQVLSPSDVCNTRINFWTAPLPSFLRCLPGLAWGVEWGTASKEHPWSLTVQSAVSNSIHRQNLINLSLLLFQHTLGELITVIDAVCSTKKEMLSAGKSKDGVCITDACSQAVHFKKTIWTCSREKEAARSMQTTGSSV